VPARTELQAPASTRAAMGINGGKANSASILSGGKCVRIRRPPARPPVYQLYFNGVKA